MFALIKRDLKSFFCNPISLIVISILNIIPAIALAIFLKTSQSQSAYVGFENIVSLMVIAFAIAIPMITILSVVRDTKAGYQEFVYSMPIAKASFVLSKFITLIIFFAIPTAVTAIIPIVLKSFGAVNFLHAYIALVFLLAFEIFVIALSLMISVRTGKMLSSFILSYSVLAVSFGLGILSSIVRFLPFGTGFDRIVGGILSELSFFKKADSIVYELFDWTVLAFFIVGAIVFLVIALADVKRKLQPILISILLVACLGVLPLLLPYSIRQIDINSNKFYTPAESTKNYLSSVDDNITVYLIDPYSNEQELYNTILRTAELGKNIDVQIVNSAEDKELLQKYGLANEAQESLSYAMIVESDKRWTFINGADYFVYNNSRMGYMSAEEFQYYYTLLASTVNQMYPYYSKFTEEQSERFEVYVSVLQSLQNETEVCLQLENAFVDAIAYVTTDVIPTVYFLSGHGEEGTTANPYDFKKAGNLPKNTDVAVINSPSEDYSKAEIDTLIEYVENGGKLYILTDIDNYSMPNFMSLLTRYGLRVETDVISADGKTAIPIEVNKGHDAFSKMSASKVTMKDVNKITYLEDSGYTYAPMLSYKVTENDGEAENTVEYPVAVSVSDGEEKKITLFTGATTFNSSESGLSEEELAEVSPCVTNVMSWMFDAFESNVENAPPKSYQKTIYMADSGQISKIVIAFVAFAFIIALSCSAYILSRNLRSKRAILANDAE